MVGGTTPILCPRYLLGMSIRALLLGVERRLRSAEVFNDRPSDPVGQLVGIQPAPGIPPRNFGQFYVSLHWNNGSGNDKNPQRHDVFQGVIATVTARLNYAPKDRQAQRFTTTGDLYDLVDKIAGPNIVHGNWDVIRFANEQIPGTQDYVNAAEDGTATVNGYMETLVLDTFGPERVAPGDWVSSDAVKDVFVVDIRFSRARRIQANY